jgi:hypothetical protein
LERRLSVILPVVCQLLFDIGVHSKRPSKKLSLVASYKRESCANRDLGDAAAERTWSELPPQVENSDICRYKNTGALTSRAGPR